MIHFVQELFKFEGRARMCNKETDACQVKVTMPVCDNAVEDVLIERCILNEIKALWNKGIKTYCSCCGHGLPYNAFITVAKEDADKMTEMGYESPPDLLDVCESCSMGVMFVPKSVLSEEAYG